MPSTSTSPTNRASCALSLSPTIDVASPLPDAREPPQRSLPPSNATRTIQGSVVALPPVWSRAMSECRTSPTDRNRRHCSVIPDACPRHQFDDSRPFPIPTSNAHRLPSGGRVGGHLLEGRQSLSFLARSSPCPTLALRCCFIERRITAQASHHRHRRAHRP